MPVSVWWLGGIALIVAVLGYAIVRIIGCLPEADESDELRGGTDLLVGARSAQRPSAPPPRHILVPVGRSQPDPTVTEDGQIEV